MLFFLWDNFRGRLFPFYCDIWWVLKDTCPPCDSMPSALITIPSPPQGCLHLCPFPRRNRCPDSSSFMNHALVVSALELQINGTAGQTLFCVRASFIHKSVLRFSHVVTFISSPWFSPVGSIVFAWRCDSLFIHSAVDGHPVCFQFLPVINKPIQTALYS